MSVEEVEVDVMVEQGPSSDPPHVLVVLQHGIFAVADHFLVWERTLREKWRIRFGLASPESLEPSETSPTLPEDDDHLHILRPTANERLRTLRGIDVCGQALSDSIRQYFEESTLSTLPDSVPIYFVIVGHSLGGLIARSALGHLFSTPFWERVTPHSFLTTVTPHLGVKLPVDRNSGLKRFFHDKIGCESGLILRLTGKEMVFADEGMFLARMADPDEPYYQALADFRFRTVAGSSHHDLKVPFCSATIRACMPYPDPSVEPYFQPRIVGLTGFDCENGAAGNYLMEYCVERDWIPFVDGFDKGVDDGYFGEVAGVSEGVGDMEAESDESDDGTVLMMRDNVSQIEFPRRVLRNLQKLHWRRLDVQFQLTKSPPIFVYETHSVWLKKWMPFASRQHVLAGTTTVDLLVEMVLLDFSEPS